MNPWFITVGIKFAVTGLSIMCYRRALMRNPQEYNRFVQSLESKTAGVLFFSRIGKQIYITDDTHVILGIWDTDKGSPV